MNSVFSVLQLQMRSTHATLAPASCCLHFVKCHTKFTQYQLCILLPVGQEGGAAQVEVQDPYQNEPERHPALIVRSAKPFNAETPRVRRANWTECVTAGHLTPLAVQSSARLRRHKHPDATALGPDTSPSSCRCCLGSS